MVNVIAALIIIGLIIMKLFMMRIQLPSFQKAVCEIYHLYILQWVKGITYTVYETHRFPIGHS